MATVGKVWQTWYTHSIHIYSQCQNGWCWNTNSDFFGPFLKSKHEKAHCKIWLLTLLYLGRSTYPAIQQHAAALDGALYSIILSFYPPLHHPAVQILLHWCDSAVQWCWCSSAVKLFLQCSVCSSLMQWCSSEVKLCSSAVQWSSWLQHSVCSSVVSAGQLQPQRSKVNPRCWESAVDSSSSLYT